MPTPEEMAEALAKVKADASAELPATETVTDAAQIEEALADTVEEPVSEILAVASKIAEILKEYNNEVSSIPRSSEYWDLNNRFNALRNP